MKGYVTAIDLGATSGRIILSEVSSGSIEMEELVRFDNNIKEIDGKCYWDIEKLYSEIIHGLEIALESGKKILSIGVDTWGVDVGFIDKEGKILSNPRAYRDTYTVGSPEEFFKIIPSEEVYQRTGIQIMNFNTLFQLFAARKENYKPLADADKILFIPDLISYMLTGNKVCEYTILSTSQFLDPKTKKMDEELLAAVGLNSSKFPPIVMPGTKVGYYKNIPVFAVAGHDTASAVAAVPSEDEKFAYLSSGTWSLMGIEVLNPILTEMARKSNFTNEGGVGGTIRFLKNITGMWILEQCRKEWKESGIVYSYDEIVKMVEEAEPLKSFIDPDDDSFSNPKSMVDAILSFCGEHDMLLPKTHSQILRCIMESLALKYRFVFETLKDIAPFPLNRLHIIGGGAKNNLLNQFTADSLGVPVYAGPSEATAIGNIMLQCKALGIVDDMADMKKMIRESIQMQIFIPSDKEKWDVAYEIYKKNCL